MEFVEYLIIKFHFSHGFNYGIYLHIHLVILSKNSAIGRVVGRVSLRIWAEDFLVFGAFGALFLTLTSPSKHFHYDNRSLLAGSE